MKPKILITLAFATLICSCQKNNNLKKIKAKQKIKIYLTLLLFLLLSTSTSAQKSTNIYGKWYVNDKCMQNYKQNIGTNEISTQPQIIIFVKNLDRIIDENNQTAECLEIKKNKTVVGSKIQTEKENGKLIIQINNIQNSLGKYTPKNSLIEIFSENKKYIIKSINDSVLVLQAIWYLPEEELFEKNNRSLPKTIEGIWEVKEQGKTSTLEFTKKGEIIGNKLNGYLDQQKIYFEYNADKKLLKIGKEKYILEGTDVLKKIQFDSLYVKWLAQDKFAVLRNENSNTNFVQLKKIKNKKTGAETMVTSFQFNNAQSNFKNETIDFISQYNTTEADAQKKVIAMKKDFCDSMALAINGTEAATKYSIFKQNLYEITEIALAATDNVKARTIIKYAYYTKLYEYFLYQVLTETTQNTDGYSEIVDTVVQESIAEVVEEPTMSDIELDKIYARRKIPFDSILIEKSKNGWEIYTKGQENFNFFTVESKEKGKPFFQNENEPIFIEGQKIYLIIGQRYQHNEEDTYPQELYIYESIFQIDAIAELRVIEDWEGKFFIAIGLNYGYEMQLHYGKLIINKVEK